MSTQKMWVVDLHSCRYAEWEGMVKVDKQSYAGFQVGTSDKMHVDPACCFKTEVECIRALRLRELQAITYAEKEQDRWHKIMEEHAENVMDLEYRLRKLEEEIAAAEMILLKGLAE